MPKVKQALDLKQTCVLNIAKNMESNWCADYKKHFFDQGKFIHVIGPFDGMPPTALHQLICLLSTYKWMKTHYLHLLIDPSLEHLDLSQCRSAANKEAIASLISARCRRLKSLRLATLNQIHQRVLQDLASSLPQLTVLDLKQTKCDDQVLAAIGSTCTNLRDLSLDSCPITDSGMTNLCVSSDPTVKKCERLRRLDITNTVVTSKGARCALENLKHLQVLLYPDICEVLYLMFGDQTVTSESSLPLQYLSIQHMKATIAPVTPSVQVACLHCAHVTEVHFLRVVGDAGVVALASLRHLRTLHLANSEEELISFQAGLLPLLQCRGAGIEDLSLSDINHIHLGCLAACCPNLTKFECLVSGFDPASFHIDADLQTSNLGFPWLQHLTFLLQSPHHNFSADYLRLLLARSTKLKTVHLAWVDALNDELFTELLEENPLLELESFTLESCPHITGEALWRLMESCNDLTRLSLIHCFQVTRADFQQYQRFAKSHNFDMKIDWL